jgi:hypothetical protein
VSILQRGAPKRCFHYEEPNVPKEFLMGQSTRLIEEKEKVMSTPTN